MENGENQTTSSPKHTELKKDMIDSHLNQWEYVSGKDGRGMKAKHNFL